MAEGPLPRAIVAYKDRGKKICIVSRQPKRQRRIMVVLAPLRLIHIPYNKRHDLADLFMEAARTADPNASVAVVEAAGARALSSPVLLAMIATIQDDHPDIPPPKQWISVGAALQNVLLATEARGFVAKMDSGRRVRSAVLRSAFTLAENSHLVGFVMVGTTRDAAASKPALRPLWRSDSFGLVTRGNIAASVT
ncbi:nitroreductase family protein [Cypionkella sp. TWP1-2-1b2]|uniref:nitroreductase family protein n=1 Tax=Cypionkella sp. TWP1-2-1b2 TaxID=2804675 RepID=UPI003CF4CFCD